MVIGLKFFIKPICTFYYSNMGYGIWVAFIENHNMGYGQCWAKRNPADGIKNQSQCNNPGLRDSDFFRLFIFSGLRDWD